MKVVLSPEKFYQLINYGPCCIVSSGNKKIKNFAPIAWVTPLNDEPPLVIVCVATTHYTSYLINKYKEFVVNVPSVDMLSVVRKSGEISGKTKDKFELLKVKCEPGKKINTVHLSDCIGFIEAKLSFRKEFSGVNLFVGSVVYCEVEKDVYQNYIIPQKAKTLHHVGGSQFFVSSKVVKL